MLHMAGPGVSKLGQRLAFVAYVFLMFMPCSGAVIGTLLVLTRKRS